MRWKKVVGVSLLALTVLAGAIVWKIGPGMIWGMLRYDTRKESALSVGSRAPDVLLAGLDGEARHRLSEQIGKRPLVLVFGSFT
jgi:hypothetical protein